MGEKRNACKILVRKSEERRSLGRKMCRWEGNINVDLKGIKYENLNQTYLTEDREHWRNFVNIVMFLRIP
jgi:hypothetical protein